MWLCTNQCCMSLNYKILLDTRRAKANGQFPVKLRVYSSTGNKETAIGISIRQCDWDEANQIILPSDPNYKANIHKLNAAKSKIERKVLLAEDDEEALLPEELITNVKKKAAPKSKVTVRQFSDELIASMRQAGKAGNSMAYKDAINSIISYSGNEALRFEDITYKLLDKYNAAMLAKGRKKNSKGLKVNAIAAYMRSVRAVYNKAIKAEVVDAKYYPFSKFTIETEDTISRALTLQEMQRIVNLDLKPDTAIWHNRNYFMLSFCLIGINFADLFTLEPNDMRESRIAYRRNKTSRIYNIGVQPTAQELLLHCQSIANRNENRYILPVLPYTSNSLQERKDIKQLCKTCNKYMKRIATACGINKIVSTYYARYTWANIAKKDLGYSNDLIADALGHQYGNKVTGIYLDNYSNEAIDAANAKIIAAVFDK